MRAWQGQARRRLLIAAMLATNSALAGCGTAAAGPPEEPPTRFADPGTPDGFPLLTPPPGTTFGLTEQLHAEFGDRPEYGGGAVSRDRTRYTIRWHGEVPPALAEIVDDYADADFDVVIEDTEFLPGDLRAEAERLVREHHPVVQGAGPRPAGDGLTVSLSTEAVQAAGGIEEALADNGIVSEFPLFPEVGDIEPA